MEGLLKSLIHSAKIAVKNPTDYEARSNIMWISTWALNNLVAKGKATDWMVHMIGHTISAHTDATHGMTLSAISLSYYRLLLPYGLKKFKRFATEVWGVKEDGKTDTEIALEGLLCMESFMKELGVVLKLKELGVTEDMFDSMVETCGVKTGGYKVLSKEEVRKVLKESL
jgi:alcohol dehydrogenase YqhD (iron-dependent ADH family)